MRNRGGEFLACLCLSVGVSLRPSLPPSLPLISSSSLHFVRPLFLPSLSFFRPQRQRRRRRRRRRAEATTPLAPQRAERRVRAHKRARPIRAVVDEGCTGSHPCHAEDRRERMSGAGWTLEVERRGRAAASLTYTAVPASPILCPLDRSHCLEM